MKPFYVSVILFFLLWHDYENSREIPKRNLCHHSHPSALLFYDLSPQCHLVLTQSVTSGFTVIRYNMDVCGTVILEFSLNGDALSWLISVNSVNLKESVKHAWIRVSLKILYVAFQLVVEWLRCWLATQEVAWSNPLDSWFFVTELIENYLGKA